MTIKATAIHFVFEPAKVSLRRVKRLMESRGYNDRLEFTEKEDGVMFTAIRHGRSALADTPQEIEAIWSVLGQRVEVSYFFIFSPTTDHGQTWSLVRRW